MAADPTVLADFTADLNPVSGSEIGRGISRGILNVGEGLVGFGETFADIVGADSAKAWLKTNGDYLAEMSRNIPRAVESFTEIKDVGTLGAYAAAAIGELIPQIGVSFGAGLAARGAATGVSGLIRGAAGAGAASYAQETGGIYRGIRDETGVEAPGTALAFGAPAAALDLLTPARFLGKVFDGATDEIKSKAWGSLVKRSFIEAAKAAPIEGLTEGIQETIAISASKFADNTYDAVNGRNFIRILDAGISGVIGGGLIGLGTPLAQRAVKQDDPTPETTRRDLQTNVTGVPEAPLASIGPTSIVTPAQDAEYLDAVKRGDTATAQRLVDEAVQLSMEQSKIRDPKTGALIKLQHDTATQFTEFKPGGNNPRLSGVAIWMSPAGHPLRAAHNVQKKGVVPIRMNLYADIRNPLILDSDEMIQWAKNAFKTTAGFPRLISEQDRQRIESEGYDGIMFWSRGPEYNPKFQTPLELQEIIAFSPNQIKSAEAVTRDASGTVITPSQRFNPASPDIRYSVGPAAAAKPLAHTVESARAAIAPLMARFGINVEVLPVPPRDLGSQFANARGMAYADGRVQLFAGNIPADVNPNELFFHEVAVHLGLQIAAKTPQERRQLDSLLSSVEPRMMGEAERIAKEGGFSDFNALATRYGFDMATKDGRLGAVAELLAREAQRYAAMKNPPSWWRTLVGKLKAFLGRIFRFDIGDDGVYAIVTKGLSRAKSAQQRATVANNATVQPPLASLTPTLNKGQLEQTLAFTPQPAIREAEAIMASGQVTDLLSMFRTMIERLVPASWRERVQGATEFQRLGGINDFIAHTLMLNPRTFVQAKAELTDAGMKTLMDLHMSNGFNYVEARALATKQLLEAQRAIVESPGMIQRILRARSALERSQVADWSQRRLTRQIRNGIARAQRRARESGGNQAEFDAAQEQIRVYDELQGRVPELQAAVDALVTSIALDPQSVEGVMGGVMPDAATLLRNHFAVNPRPASEVDTYGNRTNQRMAVLRIAADVLARSQILAQRALASQWAEDSEVTREANNLEERIRQSVNTGTMRQEIDRALRSVVALATASGKADALFRLRNRAIHSQFDKFQQLQYADEVFSAVIGSPEYRAMRIAVGAATGERIVPTAAKGVALESALRSKHVIVMPDGTAREFVMHPNRKAWEEQMADSIMADGTTRPGIETTLADLQRWLSDDANEGSPYRGFYRDEFNRLEYLWHGSFVFDSPKIFPAARNFHFKLVDAFLRQFDSLVTSIGFRSSTNLRTIASVLKDSMHLFGDWLTRTDPVFTRSMIDGAMSHPDIWKTQSATDAISLWYDEVLNPLHASHQDPARPGYRTGETIPESGRRVTAQDTAARVQMARLSKQAHEIDAVQGRISVVPSTLVEDRMVPGAPHHRRAMTTSEGQVPRRMNRKAIDLVSQYLESEKKKEDRFAFWSQSHLFFVVKSMISNRDAQHSTVSDFEEAFREARTDLQRGLVDSEITDLPSLISFIEGEVEAEPGEVREFILTELDRHVRAVASAVDALRAQVTEPPSKEFATTAVKPIDRTTSFTTGRGRTIAPPWAYEYGWSNTKGLIDFAMSGNSFYVEMFIKSVLSAADELRAYQANVVKPRLAALEKIYGDKQKAKQAWLKENRDNLKLGNDLVEYERIDDFANSLEAYARDFNEQYSVGGREADVQLSTADRILSRFVSGVLFSWQTLVRNGVEGGFLHNGIRLSRLSSGIIRAFPRAGLSILKVVVPLGLRAFPATIKGAWQTARNAPRAVRTLLTTGNLIKAEGQLLGDAIETVAVSLMGSSELARGLERRGLGIPVLPKATLKNQADLWRTAGQIRPVDLSATPIKKILQATAQYGATFLDAQMALFIKPFFPRAGDLIANSAVADSTLSAMRRLEQRLKILHRTMRDAGINTSALENRQFTPNEVLGRYFGFDRTTTGLRELERLFIDGEIDFHKSVAEWFKRIDRMGYDQRWMPEDALWRLAIRNVEVINAATPFNRSLAAKKNVVTRTIFALLSWNINAYRKYADYLGRSARDDKSVWRVRLAISLWALAIMNLSGLSGEAIELLLRQLASLMGDPVRATRVPWEYDNPNDTLKSHAIYAFNAVPFVATAVNSAFNDLPNKASVSPYLLVQNKLVDLFNYIGGAVNSGDVTYKLPQLVRGFLPMSSVIINRLPEISGMREATSVARLYTRYGDKDTLAPSFARSGPGASANVTALSPYGDRISSAISRGDDQQAAALYTEAIQVAKQVGKRDPEQSVRSLVLNRLPISRAFKSTPSPAAYQSLLSRMSPSERARVESFNSIAEQGLAKLGLTTDKIRPLATARTTGSTRGRSARSRLGYRSPRIRRVRLGSSRSTSRLGARRRRNGLVRQAL